MYAIVNTTKGYEVGRTTKLEEALNGIEKIRKYCIDEYVIIIIT